MTYFQQWSGDKSRFGRLHEHMDWASWVPSNHHYYPDGGDFSRTVFTKARRGP